MKNNKTQAILALTLLYSGLHFEELYADSTGKMYGNNAPFVIGDLPAKSKLRQRLESLPEQAKQKAMENLHKFSFPENDTEFLRIDEEGGIYYDDSQKPKPITGSQNTAQTTLVALPVVDTFKLHSRPNATKKVFLDFDGHEITGTAWNSGTGKPVTYYAVAFDTDANPTNFSSTERAKIAEVWHRVSEDYAPFDIDVTTEDPINFNSTTGRIVFTKDTDSTGVAMPAQGAGGVAYVGVWGASNYATYYSPALVYYNGLGPSHPPYMAEAASHEFGHNLGLSHDGVLDGQQNPLCLGSTGYFCGLGSSLVSWGPIMGVGYYTNVTEWSKGEYPSANNTQDDMAIIGNQLKIANDNDDGSFLTAKALAVGLDGSIVSTTPENDPSNVEAVNKGIIESNSDVDTFWFDAGAGNISITVKPAWAAYYRTSTRGANLDIDAKLYDQAGNLVTSNNPLSETNATIATSVAAGRYYLTINGVGNSVTPYSNYGSSGEYFISGTVAPSATDTTPPNPNPMTWAALPYEGVKGSISMTATTAVDDSGIVEYQFQCVAGGATCPSSNWQAGSTYTASGLAPNTNYSFKVVARDAKGNTTAASETSSVTTKANQSPIATNDSVTVNEDNAVTIPVLGNDSDPDSDNLVISAVTQAGHGSVAINSGSVTYTPTANYNGADSFTYTISDGFGGNSTATVAITVSPVNDNPLAVKDTVTVKPSSSVTIAPLLNDTDVDGNSLSVKSITAATKGVASLSGNLIAYKAGAKTGTDTFSYTISDNAGGSATSTITITIKR